MSTPMQIFYFQHQDIWKHLAMEEYLLEQLSPHQRILYLWQSDRAVVLGKNQNPWKECSISLINREGIKLARRLSGGGTVYHDPGNLNFTFLCHGKSYNFNHQIQIIISALKKIGVAVTLDKNHTLTVSGLKCSGNAFCMRKDKAFHHGTLLVCVNLNNLKRYLTQPEYTIKTRAINSKRAQIINLCDVVADISCNDIVKKICESVADFQGSFSLIKDNFPHLDRPRLQRLYKKYKSWDWIYANTPKFEICLNKVISGKNCMLRLEVNKARITEIMIKAENLSTDCMRRLRNVVRGSQFNSQEIVYRIRECHPGSNQCAFLDELANWVGGMSV